ncbi:MAG: NTF2-like N-terminal transpeptidase domain-containing protein, partial [Solirubrobacteraceae bacterium]
MNTSNDRRRRARRAVPVIALAAVAFLVGAVVGSGHGGSPQLGLAERFAHAWTHDNYASMYEDIDATSQRRMSASTFADAYQAAARTATETGLTVMGSAHQDAHGIISVPMRVGTRIWGTLKESLLMNVQDEPGGERVIWSHSLVF